MTADLRTALEDLAEDLDGSVCTVGYVERELHYLLAAHPPTTQPNREQIALAISQSNDPLAEWDDWTDASKRQFLRNADAVLGLPPGRPEHEVKAEAVQGFGKNLIGLMEVSGDFRAANQVHGLLTVARAAHQ